MVQRPKGSRYTFWRTRLHLLLLAYLERHRIFSLPGKRDSGKGDGEVTSSSSAKDKDEKGSEEEESEEEGSEEEEMAAAMGGVRGG